MYSLFNTEMFLSLSSLLTQELTIATMD